MPILKAEIASSLERLIEPDMPANIMMLALMESTATLCPTQRGSKSREQGPQQFHRRGELRRVATGHRLAAQRHFQVRFTYSRWAQQHYVVAIYRAFKGTVPLVLTSLPSEELDKGYKQFGQDNRRRSPHSCLQECLNADDAANWGVICNGTTIRLLHDNPALVKPAYVAIALDQLFVGGLFDEFTVLWLLLQASRFQRVGEGECVLDGWKAKGQQTGERALNKLRDGVQLALENLANGMLQHLANHALIAQLESNELSIKDFFQELLRLVYRLLFLCVAEDRGLLFAEGTDLERQAIYRQGYSLSRLRDLAIRRSAYEGQYSDLWKVQRLVFAELDRGDSPLGLPGLGGLFAREKCIHLDRLEIPNGFMLEAVKAIGWFFDEQSQSRTRINYRDLNTEEFGSVYESLLELHPLINRSGGIWRLVLGGGAGSDRKTTGN